MQPDLQAALARHEIDALDATTHPRAWQAVWDGLAYQPRAYERAELAYQRSCFRQEGRPQQVLDLVLCNDGQPCGLFPLMLDGLDPASLSSDGGRLLAPLFLPGLADKTVKRLCSRLLELLRDPQLHPAEAPLDFTLPGQPDRGDAALSEWQLQLMALGARPRLRHELYVDLRPPLAEIRAGFRKSYKPLINSCLRMWSSAVMDGANADPAVWQTFKQLHIAVAGRQTRADETWDIQYRSLCAGQAFLVHLREPGSDRMVGAGFFVCTRDEGVYAVAAYDRSLFDKPLGHGVQALAIERFKAMGQRWYRVGDRPYAQDLPPPSEKEVAIGMFKQGFASHTLLRFELQLPPR